MLNSYKTTAACVASYEMITQMSPKSECADALLYNRITESQQRKSIRMRSEGFYFSDGKLN